MKEELEFVVNSLTVYCSAKWLVFSGKTWMIHRHYYRLHPIHIQNIAGMICIYISRSIEWIWVECAKIVCHGDGLKQDRQKEGRKKGHSVP